MLFFVFYVFFRFVFFLFFLVVRSFRRTLFPPRCYPVRPYLR